MTEHPDVPTARPVVVGTEGSTASDAAAFAAARTAHQLGAPLRLIRVVPLPSEDPVDAHGSGAALQRAAAQLDALRRELAQLLPELAVTAVLRRGRPGPVLVEESWDAERLVLGAHAGPGLGSVADQLVRQAHAPVLLHRDGPRPAGAVVVGLDALPGTEELLRTAAEEAQRRGAVLRVLHGRTSRLPGTGVQDAEQHLLTALVTSARSEWPALRVEVEGHPGGAAAVLLDASAPAQLLVLGRHDPGSPTRPSNTGATLLLRAPCPVLLVPLGRNRLPDPALGARELVGR